jgi:hypothetical protein
MNYKTSSNEEDELNDKETMTSPAKDCFPHAMSLDQRKKAQG